MKAVTGMTTLQRLLALALALQLWSCGRCGGCGEAGGEEHLAELVSATAPVQRDHAGSQGQWTEASQGARFSLGDGLRTGPGGAARVALRQGGALRLGEDSFIRFLASAPEAPRRPRLQVEVGDLEVRSGEEVGLEVNTGGGQVRLERASALEIEYRGEDQASFEVTVGEARFLAPEAAGQEAQPLPRGERVVVNLRTGRLEPGAAAVEPATNDGGAAGDGGPEPEEVTGSFQVSIRGANAQLRAPGGAGWSQLDAGQRELPSGATLRLGASTSAEVRRGGAQATLSPASEATLGGSATLTLSRGQAMVSTATGATSIAVPGGTIILRPNSRSTVNIGRRGRADVRALRGRVEVRGAGDAVLLGPGAVATLTRAGAATVEGPPSRAEIVLSAGTPATIHTPRPPVNVGIRVGETCPGAALVEITGSDEGDPVVAEDDALVILRLPTGAHEYRMLCVNEDDPGREETASTARLRIIHDPGTSPMGVPSHNTVDADGRSYTVLYGTVPPRITFRWPDAPARGPFQLTVQASSGRSFSRSTSRPRLTMGSGTLTRGSYQFSFTSADGRRSPQGRLTIRTDTTVALVSIHEPQDGAVPPGSQVRVAGIAREGSTVSVGGTTVPFESATRFGGQVTAPTDTDAMAIRVVHPSAGAHFFLRRLTKRAP